MSPALSPPIRRVSWAELLAHQEVEERSCLAGPVGIMAFHGGLEAGTAEIAEGAAERAGASLYLVRQPVNLRWHVPSHQVDPAHSRQLAGWMSHVRVVMAVHGYGRIGRPGRILLGGRNRGLATRLAGPLAIRLPSLTVVTDLEEMPPELRGLHPANPVNRAQHAGVQLELPPRARDRRLDPNAPSLVAEALAEVAIAYSEAASRWPGQIRSVGGEGQSFREE